MTNQPNSYKELIQYASDCISFSKAEGYNVLKYKGFEPTSTFSHAQIIYVTDYAEHKYLYFEPKFQRLLGYDQEIAPDMASKHFPHLWNRNDFKIFNEKIFPETVYFLKQYSVSDYPFFSFSFNYRVKAKDGKDHTLLQRSTYFSDSEDGNALAAVGIIVDITNYKTDSSIIHTVEKIDRDNSTTSKVSLFNHAMYFVPLLWYKSMV